MNINGITAVVVNPTLRAATNTKPNPPETACDSCWHADTRDAICRGCVHDRRGMGYEDRWEDYRDHEED